MESNWKEERQIFLSFLFKSCLGEDAWRSSIILSGGKRGYESVKDEDNVELWVFIGVEDGRFEKEIGWNVVKGDFKVGEGGERGGGLILGDIRYIYTFLRLVRVFGNKIGRVEKGSWSVTNFYRTLHTLRRGSDDERRISLRFFLKKNK